MTAFLCCGIPRRSKQHRRKGGDTQDLYSSAVSGCSDDAVDGRAFCEMEFGNESMDVHHSSIRNVGSLCCSQTSNISGVPLSKREMLEGNCRDASSLENFSSNITSPCGSWVGQYESYDHEQLLDEVVKLRRAVDVTYSELVVTEGELRKALLELASSKKLSVRKRSGSCPTGLPPTAASTPVFSSSINTLLKQ